jgi:hypothetical protein
MLAPGSWLAPRLGLAPRRDVLFMLPIGLGLALFLFGTQRPGVTAPAPSAGNLLAMLSGITFALAATSRRSTRFGAGWFTAGCRVPLFWVECWCWARRSRVRYGPNRRIRPKNDPADLTETLSPH